MYGAILGRKRCRVNSKSRRILRGAEREHEGQLPCPWRQVPPAIGPTFHPREIGPGQERVLGKRGDAQSCTQQCPKNLCQAVKPVIGHTLDGGIGYGIGALFLFLQWSRLREVWIAELECSVLSLIIKHVYHGMRFNN